MSDWGDRIQKRRQELGFSQTQLAHACGLKPASVNDWESGKTKTIEGANLLRAARYLQTTPEWIIFGTGAEAAEASQLGRRDTDTLEAGLKLIKAVTKITRQPLEDAMNALAISVAMEIVNEAEEGLDDSNVLDFMAKFAERLEKRRQGDGNQRSKDQRASS